MDVDDDFWERLQKGLHDPGSRRVREPLQSRRIEPEFAAPQAAVV
jgi:hypothetical protein